MKAEEGEKRRSGRLLVDTNFTNGATAINIEPVVEGGPEEVLKKLAD